MERFAGLGPFRRPRAIQAEGEASRNDMDPQIWSRLPYEFLCPILERVPTDALMRWRRVSKRWVKDYFFLLASSNLLWLPPVGETIPMYHVPVETFSANLPAVSFIVSTFNKSRYTWNDLKLHLHESHPAVQLFQGSSVFSTGGLLLLELLFIDFNHTPQSSITVFNPTTLKVRQLPPPPDESARPIGLIKYWDARSYAVVASRCIANGQGSQLFLYMSDINEWRYCGNSTEKIWPIPTASAVSIGTLLYFLLERETLPSQKKYRMFAFDVITQTCQDWGQVPRHHGGGKPALMEIGGVMLYAARTLLSDRYCRHITWSFYKLNPESLKWDEARCMPMGVHRQLMERIDSRGLKVTGAGNFIYFYGYSSSLPGPHHVLAHNHSDDTWYWIPRISSPVGHLQVSLKQSVIISLEPSLMPV